MQQTVSIVVRGRVQGVFYRQSTLQKALALNITGTVRNLPDGSVCIVATGTKPDLDALVDWCRQGPARAQVSAVECRQEATVVNFPDFRVLR